MRRRTAIERLAAGVAGAVVPFTVVAGWQARRASAMQVRSTHTGAAMAVPRAAHTATSLRSGAVLICGGFGAPGTEGGALALYDPGRDRWTPLAGGAARHSHSATLLDDGRVLFAGGYAGGGEPMPGVEIYDAPQARIGDAGAMAQARAGHEAVRLDDGRVLIVGGVAPGWQFLATAEIFDPVTSRWAATASMSTPRESHAAVRLRDGRVLVVGGHRGPRGRLEVLASCEIYDSRRGVFEPCGPLATRRHKHDAVALPNGHVFVVGGADERDDRGVYTSTEIFDPATGHFRAGPSLRAGRYKHRGTSFVQPDGRVLLAGGADAAEVIDPRSGDGTLLPSPVALSGQFSAAARLPDGRTLVVGGYGAGRPPQAATWLIDA